MVLTDGPTLGRVRRRGHEDTLNPCIEDKTDWAGLDWIELNCLGIVPKRDFSVGSISLVKTETGGFALLEHYDSHCQPGFRPCVPEQLQSLPIWGECMITGWIRSTQSTSFMIVAGHTRLGRWSALDTGHYDMMSQYHTLVTCPMIHISHFSSRFFRFSTIASPSSCVPRDPCAPARHP